MERCSRRPVFPTDRPRTRSEALKERVDLHPAQRHEHASSDSMALYSIAIYKQMDQNGAMLSHLGESGHIKDVKAVFWDGSVGATQTKVLS